MVDPIAGKPISSEGATARIAAAQPVAPTPSPTATRTQTPIATAPDLAQTSGVARQMAASAPVNTDRVATIKKAIAEGRFPITPATIADRLIALKLQWHPDDAGGHDQA